MTDTRFKKTTNEIVLDTKTGLEWQANATESITWREAMDYAESLGDGWRLPTIEELITLIDYNRSNPATGFPDHPSAWFWSSSVYASNSSYACFVYFYNGYVYHNDKYYNYHVRCVRQRDALEAEGERGLR